MARLTDRPQGPPTPPPPVSRGRPPRAPLPPASAALHQRSWAALTLASLSLLAMALIGNTNIRRMTVVFVVTLVIAALALTLAISAMSAAKRARTARPRGAVFATVLAGAGLLFSGFTLAAFAVFWPQLTTFYNCMGGAGTVSAQDACQQRFNNSVGAEITVLSGR